MARKSYAVSAAHGGMGPTVGTKAKARKEQAAIVREAAAQCRRSYKRCTVKRRGNVVEILIGGKQSASMYNRYGIVESTSRYSLSGARRRRKKR